VPGSFSEWIQASLAGGCQRRGNCRKGVYESGERAASTAS
jgi:hypothetical protein